MKYVKRLTSIILSLLMVFIFMATPISAQKATNHSEETVLYLPTPRSYQSMAAPSYVVDLGNFPVAFSLPVLQPDDMAYTPFAFRTNTMKLYLHLKGDVYGYIRVTFLDKDTEQVISTQSFALEAWGKNILYPSLTSNKSYYFKIENFGQTTINITATVQSYYG